MESIVVSEGTLRPEDLFERFREYISNHAPEYLAIPNHAKVATLEEFAAMDAEDQGWELEALFYFMEEIAPPGTYFGAHEGDGSCFGFWIDDDYDAEDDEDDDDWEEC